MINKVNIHICHFKNQLSIKKIILISCFILISLVAFYFSTKLFYKETKYKANLVGSTKLGLTNEMADNFIFRRHIGSTSTILDNPYLDSSNYLLHFRLTSLKGESLNVNLFVPGVNRTAIITYANNIKSDSTDLLKYEGIQSGYVNLKNINLSPKDNIDVWLILSCKDTDSLNYLTDPKNFHFKLDNEVIVNFTKQVSYLEELKTIHTTVFNYIIETPFIQGVLFLLSTYGVFIILFYFIRNSIYRRIFKLTFKKYLFITISVGLFLLCAYNKCFNIGTQNDEYEIIEEPFDYIPAFSIYGVYADSFYVNVPFDMENGKPNYYKATTMPVRFRKDTLIRNCSYIHTYSIRSKNYGMIPNIKVFCSHISLKETVTQAFLNSLEYSDDIMIFNGGIKDNSIRVFSANQILADNLRFQIQGKDYRIGYVRKNLNTYGAFDYILSKNIANKIFLQLIILLLAFISILRFLKKIVHILMNKY